MKTHNTLKVVYTILGGSGEPGDLPHTPGVHIKNLSSLMSEWTSGKL